MSSNLPDWNDSEAVVRWAKPDLKTNAKSPASWDAIRGMRFVREKEMLHNPAFANPHTAVTPEMPAAESACRNCFREIVRYDAQWFHKEEAGAGLKLCALSDLNPNGRLDLEAEPQPAVPASRESSQAEADFQLLLHELSHEKDRRKRIELVKEAMQFFVARQPAPAYHDVAQGLADALEASATRRLPDGTFCFCADGYPPHWSWCQNARAALAAWKAVAR